MKYEQLGTYIFNQEIQETDEEYIFTAKLTIKKSKEGMKYIENMFEKQQSPIITILDKIENQRKREVKTGKYEKPYYIEGELEKH